MCIRRIRFSTSLLYCKRVILIMLVACSIRHSLMNLLECERENQNFVLIIFAIQIFNYIRTHIESKLTLQKDYHSFNIARQFVLLCTVIIYCRYPFGESVLPSSVSLELSCLQLKLSSQYVRQMILISISWT